MKLLPNTFVLAPDSTGYFLEPITTKAQQQTVDTIAHHIFTTDTYIDNVDNKVFDMSASLNDSQSCVQRVQGNPVLNESRVADSNAESVNRTRVSIQIIRTILVVMRINTIISISQILPLEVVVVLMATICRKCQISLWRVIVNHVLMSQLLGDRNICDVNLFMFVIRNI